MIPSSHEKFAEKLNRYSGISNSEIVVIFIVVAAGRPHVASSHHTIGSRICTDIIGSYLKFKFRDSLGDTTVYVATVENHRDVQTSTEVWAMAT